MHYATTIDELQMKHDLLYKRALENGSRFSAGSVQYKAFLQDVEGLLRQIETISAEVESFEEYRWLSDAAVKWHVVFSSLFKSPRTIRLAQPRKAFFPPPQAMYTTEEIEYWLKRNAEYLDFNQIAHLGRPLSDIEKKSDWHTAEVMFASEILDGKVNFVSRISPDAYVKLEQVWLKDVKRLSAYFNWLDRGAAFDPSGGLGDYYKACDHLRSLLVEPGIKARPAEFSEVKAYLEDRYLADGKLIHHGEAEKHAAARMLIAQKASRIWQRRKDREPNYNDSAKNDLQNWVNAEIYSKMFYENIIPAVMEDNEEKVLTVLKAFQYSKARENGWWVINCFETALAIYFLRRETILQLWTKSAESDPPQSSVHSMVQVKSWPKIFQIPEGCKDFEYDEDTIMFKGVMTESQKNVLIEKVTTPEQKTDIEKLFKQSRLIHETTTL